MQAPQLVVIGTSAGGIEALRELAAGLPTAFPASLAVVIHTSPHSPGVVHEIVGRSGPLPAVSPNHRERLKPGHIYIAPPDHHLVVEPGSLRVTKGPRENRFRPAIDPLFRTAAQYYGPRAIGVILTGNLDDGTAGLWAIKQLGGTAIVQDPGDAMFPSMPESALAHVNVDYTVPLAEIAPLLVRLTAAPEPETAPVSVPERLEVEVSIAKESDPLKAGVERIGEPSKFSCPECHGVLLEVQEAGRIRFRCHTGHAYSADSLLATIGESIEAAVWTALRMMQEGDMLMRQMADHLDAAHSRADAARLRAHANDLLRKATALRDLVMSETEATPAGG